MTGVPHWTATVSALAVAVVAVFGAFIAWNLWRTNYNVLRERLFDRRYEVFLATQKMAADVCADGKISWEAATEFSEVAQRARFMFSAEDAQYFEDLRRKALALARATAEAENGRKPEPGADAETSEQLRAWFNDQVEEIFLRMNKYLLFEK